MRTRERVVPASRVSDSVHNRIIREWSTTMTVTVHALTCHHSNGWDTLRVTQSVDPDGSGSQTAAIGWYEIRNPFGNPADPNPALRPFLYQSGTFNPGASGNRWMGSVAMNGA